MEIDDKEALYGKFEEGEKRRRDHQDERNELHIKAAHKALDIRREDEDMGDISTSQVTHNNGVSPLVAAGLIGMSIMGTSGVAYLISQQDIAPTPIVAPVKPAEDTDTKYEFRISSGDPTK